ncbi:unnamed protein product [Linum trigynum]|uniref:Secreted protein n=1 Tax=Linum trigynum TaxID=586398 RepID=A0AAV2FRG3_9ROSI
MCFSFRSVLSGAASPKRTPQSAMRYWISTTVARGFMVVTTAPVYRTARKTTGKPIELGRTSKTTSPWRMPNLWRAEAVDLTRGKRSW